MFPQIYPAIIILAVFYIVSIYSTDGKLRFVFGSVNITTFKPLDRGI